MRAAMLLVLCCGLLATVSVSAAPFRFSTVYADSMVLQRAPASASVWGYGTPNATVSLTVSGSPAVTGVVGADEKWQILLAPHTHTGGPYTVTATSGTDTVILKDILFGDVWVCSGQSNMAFTVSRVVNATEEIAKAVNYPNIRYMSVKTIESLTPVDELLGIGLKWGGASTKTLGGFSAVCWFFARNIFDKYGVPLGLIGTSYGGTPVEAWSSPDALAKCGASSELVDPDAEVDLTVNKTGLWNAMIFPFLRTTIYGATWYQGEANAGKTNYVCTFPTMVDDWREKWYQYALGTTSKTFPFGLVQLSTWNANDNSVATLRYQQTANIGYVPNTRQVNTFMAEAMDLGSPPPTHDIHPTNKQDVGYRLALGGRAIAYGDSSVYWTGPLVASAKMEASLPNGDVVVSVTLRNTGAGGIELRNSTGFELQDKTALTWTMGVTTQTGAGSIAVKANLASGVAAAVRYAWRAVPCEQKECALYSKTEAIPGPPFLQVVA